MKRGGSIKIIVQLWIMISLLVVLPIVASSEVPQQINFQGYLTDASGNPLDGDYQMDLSIYDVPTGGAIPLWSEGQTVLVINGIYNVQIGQDPIGNPFPGTLFEGQRWLGVTVESDAEMIPRQPLTCTPFAMRAEVAETIIDGGVSTVHIADSAINSNKVADGSVAAVDLKDGTALAEILDDDGPGSGLNADSLDGYSSSAFVRTLQDYGRSGVASNLYEGTSSLASKYVNVTGDTMSGSSTGNMLEVNNSLSSGGGYGVYARTYSETGAAVAGFAMNNGDVQNQGGRFLAYGDDGRGVYGLAADSGTGTNYGGYFEGYSSSGRGVYAKATGNYGRGVVGAATNTGAYTNYGGYFTSAGAYGRAVYGRATNSGAYPNYGGYFHADGAKGRGVYGYATGASAYGLYGVSTNGDGLYASTSASDEHAGYFTTSVGGGLPGASVYARTNSAAGIALWAHNDHTSSTDATAVLSNTGSGALLKGFGGNGGEDEFRINNDGTMVFYNINHKRTVQIDPNEGGLASGSQITLYDSDGAATIEIDGDFGGDGRVTTQELQITGGSDLSEQFDIRGQGIEIKPGMVVSIDPDQPGHLQLSNSAYDNRVAGIISGAGGIKSGMMMGQRGTEADGQHPVALSGRVYCWADASNGRIRPGDLLTTSDLPGHAMKVADHTRSNGAILGKAMTALQDKTGLVLVLVSLQ